MATGRRDLEQHDGHYLLRHNHSSAPIFKFFQSQGLSSARYLRQEHRQRGERGGSGSALLRDAVLRTTEAAHILGIRGLVVHALSDAARAFYEHHGFTASPTQPMTLILSLKTDGPTV